MLWRVVATESLLTKAIPKRQGAHTRQWINCCPIFHLFRGCKINLYCSPKRKITYVKPNNFVNFSLSFEPVGLTAAATATGQPLRKRGQKVRADGLQKQPTLWNGRSRARKTTRDCGGFLNLSSWIINNQLLSPFFFALLRSGQRKGGGGFQKDLLQILLFEVPTETWV